MKRSGIYSIQNTLTGAVYIGSSIDVDYRIHKQHIKMLRHGNHYNTHLQHAWNKYGEKSFKFSLLEECESDNLLDREQYYINNTSNLYNISKSAIAPFKGLSHSDDSKHKISIKLRDRQFSKEHKKNLSTASIGKIGHSAWNRGISCSDSTKLKISSTQSKKLWQFLDPNGQLHEFYNLTKFCKENNLHQGMMWEVSTGRLNRTQHKGWTKVK